MIDTIHIWIPESEIKGIDMMAEIPNCLNQVVAHHPLGREEYLSGNLRNVRVNISDRGVSLKGSLSRFYLGNNCYSLTRGQTYQAVMALSDMLHLAVKRGKLTRLDIAQNILTDHPPKAYFIYLGDARFFKRLEQPSSLNYRNGNRQIVMYDKTLESRKKKELIPDEFMGKNVFRLEYRYMKNLRHQVRYIPFSVASLWEKPFYQYMKNEWENAYHSINKNRFVPLNLKEIKKPKDLIDQLVMEGLAHIGGEHKVMDIVEELRFRNAFSKPEYYSRAKQMIRKYRSKRLGAAENDLIAELDRKVDEVDFLE